MTTAWQRTIVNDLGEPIPNALVDVYIAGTATRATIFSTHTGTAQTNPFTATAAGFARFYAAGGVYDITITGGGQTQTWQRVALGTAQAVDAVTGTSDTTANRLLRTGATGDQLAADLSRTGAQTIGTINDANVLVKRNGAEVARFGAGGRLLVGTTTDDGSSVLQTVGNVRVGANGGSAQIILNGQGRTTWPEASGDAASLADVLANGGTATAYDMAVRHATVASLRSSAEMPLWTSGTEKARFTADGKLLIGKTTDDGNLLQINGGLSANAATLRSATIGGRASALSAPGSLFARMGLENTLERAGTYEVTTVDCTAGSAVGAGTYFRIYGPDLSGAAISETAAGVPVDVWMTLDGAGTEPASSADRYLPVAILSGDTADDVATKVAAAINADVGFTSFAQGNKIYILPTMTGDYTDATAETSGFTVTKVADGSGNLTGTLKWYGGVLAPNGKIYCVPNSATEVLIIDPATNTTDRTSISTGLSGSNKWYGGVLAPNGKIYCVPRNAEEVLIIDPTTNTADRTSISTGLSGSNKWFGGVLAPNGKIYCVPDSAEEVLIIDPTTNTADRTSITGLSGSEKWYGGVLAPNGKIYCVPRNAEEVLIIDPATNTTDRTSISTGLSGSEKWYGGVLAPNGKIYCVPGTATEVLIIDPTTNTTDRTSISTGLSGAGKWFGGVLAPNGKIYCVPNSATEVLIIDPTTNTADRESITGLGGTNKCFGGVLAPNGKIYCVPNSAQNALAINGGSQAIPSWYLSAHYNKL
jgi:hypothetical protein